VYGAPMAAVDDETVGVLLDLAQTERQVRLDSLDTLDGKAGVLIGFAGVLVGLTATLPQWWARLLVMLPSLLSALAAFDALRVKKVPGFRLQQTRDKYLTQPRHIVRQTLLDTMISNQAAIEKSLKTKADRVTVALWLLGVAILVMAVLLLITGGS